MFILVYCVNFKEPYAIYQPRSHGLSSTRTLATLLHPCTTRLAIFAWWNRTAAEANLRWKKSSEN